MQSSTMAKSSVCRSCRQQDKEKEMGGHARQQWMYEARELSELMEQFQLDPSDEHLSVLLERLRMYQDGVRKNDIQPPHTFKSF